MSNVAIIPARGGSKRIPRKNIKDFLGKPIIAYSIEAALKSGLFDEVMVSTDDEEIAQVAKAFGATVPFMRSAKASDDFATLADVIDDVISAYKRDNKEFKFGCCILPTAPFVTPELLLKSLKLLNESNANSVRPVVRFSYPIQRAVRMDKDGTLEMFQPEFAKTRSQDIETAYHDAAQFYWFEFGTGMRGTRKLGFELPELSVQDIDTIEDWKIAELKYKFII